MKPVSVESLPDALQREIAKRAPTRTYLRNAIIVTEGDDTDTLYVLLAGRAKVLSNYCLADNTRRLGAEFAGRMAT